MNGLDPLPSKSTMRFNKLIAIAWLAMGGLAGLYSSLASAQTSEIAGSGEKKVLGGEKMKIQFVFDDRTIGATLNDTPSARDFVGQLPLTLDLEDYASTEKIAYLPSKLTKEGSPPGVSAKVGDISYYAPWGNLVVFYKDFGYSSGLIKLGEIDSGIERFTANRSMKVTVERVP
ncbi:cyclophilin-like fold protein [Photobacterium rosenbergii]|uniref:Cyclophilin-like fold protein n=1 Tax=Photobacterium rosenbergii TaxID=294936 RepID=A0ABU3ZNU5_9GAMM|nr:cyclophilin-like fold protein [Photobacterium rosenbergii]MDV5171598.1 cyclophilin-like fold protein [Photobacterium rosenbergii]